MGKFRDWQVIYGGFLIIWTIVSIISFFFLNKDYTRLSINDYDIISIHNILVSWNNIIVIVLLIISAYFFFTKNNKAIFWNRLSLIYGIISALFLYIHLLLFISLQKFIESMNIARITSLLITIIFIR